MDAPTLPASTISITRPPFPYPGLRPFEADEWQIFFGRETMTDDIIERLAREHLVLMHGASGSGKSSLVRAGVLPRLARQHLRQGTPWLTCAMRPSAGPLWSLAAELARLEGQPDDLRRIGELMRLFNRRDATLPGVIGAIDAFAGKRLCILVDQFEELFRFERETSREEAELFVNLLVATLPAAPDGGHDGAGEHDGAGVRGLAGEHGGAGERGLAGGRGGAGAHRHTAPRAGDVHVILTMRSEFLGECGRFDGFAEAVNRAQYLVPPLTQAALMRAIRQPARLYGGEVTEDLALRLIADVHGKQDELPLIQHGLMLFWHAATQAAPGASVVLDSPVLQSAGGLAQLLSDHADKVMREAAPTPADQVGVERLFRGLTDINAERQAIRRPQSFRDLVATCAIPPERLRQLIDAFRAEGVSFLTPYVPASISERTVIDISHEALIRYWRVVADPQTGWLRREFNDGLVWHSLVYEAKEFAQDRKRVLSAATTAERQRWLADHSPAWSERHGGQWALVERFVQASRQAVMRRRRVRRLWLLPAIGSAAVAPPLLIDDWLFDAFKPSVDTFGGLVVVTVGGLMMLTVLAMLADYTFSAIGWLWERRRRVPASPTPPSGRTGAARWRRWGSLWRTRWARLRTPAYLVLFVLYLGSLGYLFHGAADDHAAFDLQVGNAAHRATQYRQAFAWYRAAAADGNSEAQYDVGAMYASGEGVTADDAQAMLWYQKAAEQGYPAAERKVGEFYEEGRGVGQDYLIALVWYGKAADRNDAKSAIHIGELFYAGRGVARDYGQAIIWYRKAADLGSVWAFDRIGLMYMDGLGVGVDYAQAMTWYRKAADQSDPTAYNNIGYMYEKGLGVPRDYAQAMAMYHKAADLGAATAKYHIGTLYDGGLGVPKDAEQALEWMMKAAEGGEELAKTWLKTRLTGH